MPKEVLCKAVLNSYSRYFFQKFKVDGIMLLTPYHYLANSQLHQFLLIFDLTMFCSV